MRDPRLAALPLLLLLGPAPVAGGEWTDWRGPARDGTSPERALPVRWSPAGDNLAWTAPFGARSTPVVLGGRLYLQNSVGEGARLQERVVCLDADTGRRLWEHRFNVYLSDVPPHRVGWASPVGDPATDRVYAFGGGGTLLGLDREGRLLWERSLAEDFGLITTHGGRTVSPVIEGDLVIVSGLTLGWGGQARPAHRFLAFDKGSGETVWVSSPGGRPLDTTYSPPIATVVGGTRLLIAGGSDGAVHALKPQTGEPVWDFAVSKRGLNTGMVVHGGHAIVTHSEENLDTSEMGLVAAVDLASRGSVTKDDVKWAVHGFQGGFSSPVVDGDRIYQIDNGANLAAFDAVTGRQLWVQNLGTIQKASPVLADGKLYVGTENGTFFILKPGPRGAEVLDQDALGSEASPEAIVASVAISRGRIYLASMERLYCIGKKSAQPSAKASPPAAPAPGAPAYVQVRPTEVVLKPGRSLRLRAHLFDEHGLFVREEPSPTWSLQNLRGDVGADGTFVAAAEGPPQAGEVKATAGGLTGAARVRVVPPLPWTYDFEGASGVPPHWINATGKYAVRDLDGGRVLVKLADNPPTRRGRVFMGPSDAADYSVEVDVRARQERRQMGDGGVVAQRYSLVLFGNHQRLELQSWQPETERTVITAFSWKPDVWYRLKLRVENRPDGTVRALGKAWPAGETEPAAWSLERVDPIGNRQGSPGIYADASAEVFFDNLKVTPNR